MATYSITCGGSGCSDILGNLDYPDGQDATKALSGYFCESARVDNISPNTGPAAGGTAVTITGHRLNSSTLSIMFGSSPALNWRSISDTSITVDSPPGATGNVTVAVQTQFGPRTSGGAASATFTYT